MANAFTVNSSVTRESLMMREATRYPVRRASLTFRGAELEVDGERRELSQRRKAVRRRLARMELARDRNCAQARIQIADVQELLEHG